MALSSVAVSSPFSTDQTPAGYKAFERSAAKRGRHTFFSVVFSYALVCAFAKLVNTIKAIRKLILFMIKV